MARPKRSPRPSPTALSGPEALRALAHPTRLHVIELLRRKPRSASEIARTFGIRYGSAYFHLRILVRAGIAQEVERRTVRGGTEILYAIPKGFSVPWDPSSPPELWGAIAGTHAADLARRLNEAAADRRLSDAETDRMAMLDMTLSPDEARAAVAAIDRMLERIRRLRGDGAEPEPGAERFTLALNFFRAPEGREP